MLTGPDKAVLFLLSLDEDAATPLLLEMKEPELRKLRESAGKMSEVRADSLDEVYRDFLSRAGDAVAVPRGGVSYLRRLTAGALGEDRARALFDDGAASPLERLESARPDVVAMILEREPPQLVAAVLAQLTPAAAAAIIAAMSPERQRAVIEGVGRMTEVPVSAIEDVAAALVGELPAEGGDALIAIDGMAKAAGILNAAGRETSRQILEQLQDAEPDLAQRLRLSMFTFDDLLRLDARAMQALLREIPTERLTIALKNAPELLRDAIFKGLSSRAADLIRDDLQLLGATRRSEIEAARKEIIETALRLEGEGTLDLGRGEDS